jgi:methylglutaconyl-CoA hydratase
LVARTVDCIAQVRASAEGQEGVHAFLNKRKPAWLD